MAQLKKMRRIMVRIATTLMMMGQAKQVQTEQGTKKRLSLLLLLIWKEKKRKRRVETGTSFVHR